MLKGLYILNKKSQDLIYPGFVKEQIEENVQMLAPPMTAEEVEKHPAELSECEVVFAGWGCIKFDENVLSKMPNLKAVFYGAGSIKNVVTDEFWKRGITITSAYAANAVPVAEYTLSQILFLLKNGYRFTQNYKTTKGIKPDFMPPGGFKSTVGIISLGVIGRLVCERLKPFDMNVIAYDPYACDDVFSELDVKRADTLEDIFKYSDVVSLHTPLLPQTEGMICGKHFGMMKENASFINTSRGAVVNEKEMIEVLKKRQDLFAVLDVTYPEPPEYDSPLYEMQNVMLTPHIAGSMYGECARMGQYMADELARWLSGEKMIYEIDKEKCKLMA